MNSKFRNPSPYMRYPSNIPYLCIQILNPLFQACKLMHTQNDKFPDHFTRGWMAYTQVKSDWRCFFHTLISDTRRVRCVRKMPDLNLRYGSRKYFNPSHFYVTCITDRASLYYFARWNLFWKYTYMLFFFLNSVTVRNYGKMYEISSQKNRNRVVNFRIFINRWREDPFRQKGIEFKVSSIEYFFKEIYLLVDELQILLWRTR